MVLDEAQLGRALEHLRLLRLRMERESAGPEQPAHLADAIRRLAQLHRAVMAADSPLRRYELEREGTALSQAIAPELRAFEQSRRGAQHRAAQLRDEMQRAAQGLYAERRRQAAERLSALLAEAARETAELESLAAQLAEEYELRAGSRLHGNQLARALRDAERHAQRLAAEEE